ncbi:MAG: ABC transporter substrate-binding protein [Clostridia bacterium]
MKKFAFALIAMILAGTTCLFAGCKGDENVVRVNEVTHSIFYAPLYAAINKGFFADEGIKIELTNGGGAPNSMTAVLTGAAEIGLLGPEAAIYIDQKASNNPPVVFGQLTNRDGSFIVSKTKIDNFTFANLVGKTIIGGRQGGVPAMTLQYAIEQAGLKIGTAENEVNLRTDVEFVQTLSTFKNSNANFCTLFEPTATIACAENNYHIVGSVGSVAGEVPYTAFMSKKEYLTNNRTTVKKFMKAVMRGYQFITTASDNAFAEALAPSFVGVSKESIIASIHRYKAIDAWNHTLTMSENAFNRLQDIMLNAKSITKRSLFKNVVDNSVAVEVMDELLNN